MTWRIGKVNYDITLGRCGWWWQWWTPSWHEGRGPYITIGLGWLAFYRGY